MTIILSDVRKTFAQASVGARPFLHLQDKLVGRLLFATIAQKLRSYAELYWFYRSNEQFGFIHAASDGGITAPLQSPGFHSKI